MLFVELATGTAKTKVQLAAENKHMSLPSSWTDATLEALGVARVEKTERPAVEEFQFATKDGVEQVDGVWKERWAVQELFSEYTVTDEDGVETTVTVQEQKDQKVADDLAALAATERATRDSLLKETDHYGLSDVTMPAEMTAYRQALRDVPQQEGFPSAITWPAKPE